MTLTIRAARPGDLVAIQALLSSAGLPLQGVTEHLPHFHVTEQAGTLLAVAGLEVYATGGLLRSVAVAEKVKGLGVGSDLVRRVLAKADEDRLPVLCQLTTTAADYFPRFGFVCIGRDTLPSELNASEALRGACPASAIVMRRSALALKNGS
ncbi:GNAT family N-acetyltransferase [Corallococcus sp. CA041A]|uniref:arsenic resistance N-acetyltransferase ArsN2 n=1 Tax=Corallococcus sp. CA041A TaxID=2316727 RepID=UPI000EA072DF|nr:arsenic resistance N-acetyltransferase ArsN2 [Corallococcus sp. CA041A]RKH12592.1 GNAT family N-acetyltransferase [Corallococcus sp. CA041A]